MCEAARGVSGLREAPGLDSEKARQRRRGYVSRSCFADLLADAFGQGYLLSMKLDDVQREAERLSPEEQRKLIGFLVAMDVRRDERYREELSRRLDDQDPTAWLSLKEAERRLKNDGV